MGFFDFVKDAGKKLLGKDDAPKAAAPAAAAAAPAADLMNAHKARALKRLVADLKIEVDDLDVSVDGDVATVRGKVASRENKEKVVLAVGNTAGIARVDDRLELGVEEKTADATFYTVKSGDSLSKIAKAHYGNAMKYPVIFEANKPMLSDPDKIYPGQVLRIPPIDG